MTTMTALADLIQQTNNILGRSRMNRAAKCKGKGKVPHRIDHEGPERE
jgi:hypothetical protein